WFGGSTPRFEATGVKAAIIHVDPDNANYSPMRRGSTQVPRNRNFQGTRSSTIREKTVTMILNRSLQG
ncbi:unnamed protein product, partial [Arctogadus glacialis]